MPHGHRTIRTSHGDIAVRDTAGDGLPVLFLHGNSFCKEAFDRQLESPAGRRYRFIAIDLPGHGQSSDAVNPQVDYSLPGYADLALEVLGALNVDRAVVVGWSLGGHVALEMVPRWPGLAGVMIIGSPPVAQDPASIQAGFQPIPDLMLAGQKDLSADEYDRFARAACGDRVEPFLRAALERTDGRAREILFATMFMGQASNERQIAETMSIPLAIVNGANEPFANLAYIATLKLPSLWEGKAHVLPGLGHMPFREAPEIFNPMLERFLAAVAMPATRREAAAA